MGIARLRNPALGLLSVEEYLWRSHTQAVTPLKLELSLVGNCNSLIGSDMAWSAYRSARPQQQSALSWCGTHGSSTTW